jgi:foldase protein PrsA
VVTTINNVVIYQRDVNNWYANLPSEDKQSMTEKEFVQQIVQGGGILALVNGQPIYAKEVDDLYNRLPLEYRQTITKQGLLNQTIARTLLLQAADREGIVVSDAEVYTLIDSLLAQSNMTRAQLEQQLALRNLTVPYLVREYKMQLSVNKLLNQTIYSKILVTHDEVISFYNNNTELFEQVRASHIITNSSEEAQKILDMVRNGADFGDVAQTYSLDKYSSPQGGDLGYFTRNQMVKEFSDAAFAMKVGEVSSVVRTAYGYHVIKVTAKKTMPFEEVSAQIRQALQTQKQTAAAQTYIKQLWAQANIVMY